MSTKSLNHFDLYRNFILNTFIEISLYYDYRSHEFNTKNTICISAMYR